MPDKGCGCTCSSVVALFGGLDEKDKCAPGPDVGRDDEVDEEEEGGATPAGTPTIGGRRCCRGDELALVVPPVPMLLLLAPASRSDPPLLPRDCLRACCCVAADSVAADEPPAAGPASSFGAVHAKVLFGAEVRRAPSDKTAGSIGSDKVACARSRESITAPKGLLFGSSKSRRLLRRSYVGDGAGVVASMGLMFALLPPPPSPPPLADTCAAMAAASARSWEALGEIKREACCCCGDTEEEDGGTTPPPATPTAEDAAGRGIALREPLVPDPMLAVLLPLLPRMPAACNGGSCGCVICCAPVDDATAASVVDVACGTRKRWVRSASWSRLSATEAGNELK
jgi:hypothetical protein